MNESDRKNDFDHLVLYCPHADKGIESLTMKFFLFTFPQINFSCHVQFEDVQYYIIMYCSTKKINIWPK